MSQLLLPGSNRAGNLFTDAAVVAAMVRVESCWLAALVDAGIAPAEAAADLDGLLGRGDVAAIADGAERTGNPVVPMLAPLRERAPSAARRWIHRGLTSQDVLDSALILCARDVLARLDAELAEQVGVLTLLVRKHRDSVQVARTLTQHAVPQTFGLKAAGWLHGILDAAERLAAVGPLPGQFGGAAGTLAATAELAALAGLPDPAQQARTLTATAARRLGLEPSWPWHTVRTPITLIGDALVMCTDAWGHVAGDVLTLSRPEVAEVSEPAGEGRGGSSTMPQKANPVLSVLIRRAALAAPGAAAQLHVAAADVRDERPDGAWHLEWNALQTLARTAVVAASQTTEVLSGLQVDASRMRATAEANSEALLAERNSLLGLFPDATPGPATIDAYLGSTALLIDEALTRATVWSAARS